MIRRASVKRNPLTNMRALMKLNPYSAVIKKSAAAVAEARKKSKTALLEKKREVILFSVNVCMSQIVFRLISVLIVKIVLPHVNVT
jgi:hypothetical protein